MVTKKKKIKPKRAAKTDIESSVERATILIRNKILDLTLQPGQPISYRYLSEDLVLSRTPIREALSRLTAEGLVVQEPNKGVSVAHLDIREISELMDAYEIAVRIAGYHCKFSDNLLPEIISMQKKQIKAMRNFDPLEGSYWAAKVKTRIMETSGNHYLSIFNQRMVNHAQRLMCLIYSVELKDTVFWKTQIDILQVAINREVVDAISNKDNADLEKALAKQANIFRKRIGNIFVRRELSEFVLGR